MKKTLKQEVSGNTVVSDGFATLGSPEASLDVEKGKHITVVEVKVLYVPVLLPLEAGLDMVFDIDRCTVLNGTEVSQPSLLSLRSVLCKLSIFKLNKR